MLFDGKILVSLKGIRVEFPSVQTDEKIVVALDGISTIIGKNEFIHLSGPNGSGKSTLLRVLSGLVPSTTGKAYFEKKVVTPEFIPMHCAVSMVYQDLDEAVVPLMSVGDHFAFKLFRRYGKRISFKAAKEKGRKYLRKRVFLDHLLKRYDDEALGLSGGWRQLMQLSSALCCKPDLLLLDEPTSHLSAEFTELTDDMISNDRAAAAVIYVSHLIPKDKVKNKINTHWRMDSGRLIKED